MTKTLQKFEVGKHRQCFYKSTDVRKVSMGVVSGTQHTRESLYVAWVNFFFAAISTMVLFVILIGMLNIVGHLGEGELPETGPNIDQIAKRGARLTDEQMNLLG